MSGKAAAEKTNANANANAEAKIKANAAAKTKTNAEEKAAAAATKESATASTSKSDGVDFKFWAALVTSVIGIGCLIASIVLNVQNGGGTNNNQEFKKNLPAICVPACIGSILLFIGIAIYIVQSHPSYALYGLLGVVCISLAISVIALSTSVAISQ
jgi:hypothetical protein